jgi:hypothetical protein
VFEVAVQFVLAPALVAAATLAARRYGAALGGMVSAFPAIVGPVLLIGAHRHGEAFAARSAVGTLLGIAALSAFAVAYAWAAPAHGWAASLACGWAAAAVAAALAGTLPATLGLALAVAVASLAAAHRALPRTAGGAPERLELPPGDLGLRMALTALLVVALAAAAGRLGPTLGGILAALPVLACVLAVFTHDRHGGPAAVALLRGMVAGMAGFVAFCALVAALARPAGAPLAFAAATVAALAVQGALAGADESLQGAAAGHP